MPVISTHDKTELFYEDVGKGKPVVFIHGWPLSSAMWEYQIVPLSKQGVRCIAYDRRGFGRSDHPGSGYGFDTLADDLKALLDSLKLTDVTLVGFSMGGGEVARYMSRLRGERVARCVLVSAVTPFMLKTADHPNGVEKSVFDKMMAGLVADRPAFLTDFAKQFFGAGLLRSPVSDAMLSACCEDAMRASPIATLECAKAFSSTDFRSDMASFNVPTLIIHGDSDKTVPLTVSALETASLVPGAQLEIYAGAPHGLYFTEKDRLNSDLLNFITNGRVRAAA